MLLEMMNVLEAEARKKRKGGTEKRAKKKGKSKKQPSKMVG